MSNNASLTTRGANFPQGGSPLEGWTVGTASSGPGGHCPLYPGPLGPGPLTHPIRLVRAGQEISAGNGGTGGTQGLLLEYADDEWC